MIEASDPQSPWFRPQPGQRLLAGVTTCPWAPNGLALARFLLLLFLLLHHLKLLASAPIPIRAFLRRGSRDREREGEGSGSADRRYKRSRARSWSRSGSRSWSGSRDWGRGRGSTAAGTKGEDGTTAGTMGESILAAPADTSPGGPKPHHTRKHHPNKHRIAPKGTTQFIMIMEPIP